MEQKPISMVEYYTAQAFNPVLIRVEDPAVWRDHVAKRRHLYERHLGLPLPFLKDRRVLEFGCNSGENALVLARFGARLTFVEPNALVAPRLRQLFRSFGQEASIDGFHQADIASFQTEDRFDLVVAEGFLSTLPDRDSMLAKIIRLVRPGGFGVVSFNDRYGGLLEMLRRALLYRTYALDALADVQSEQALAAARALFEEDFLKLNASRSFETWWRDTLVAPVYLDAQLWSYPEMLAILEQEGAVAHSTSPAWSTWERFDWYKNVPEPGTINRRFLEDWHRHLFFFLSGLRPLALTRTAPPQVIEDTARLVRDLSGVGSSLAAEAPAAMAAGELPAFLAADPQSQSRAFAEELESLLAVLASNSTREIRSAYHAAGLLRRLWGTAYHYLCFQRPLD